MWNGHHQDCIAYPSINDAVGIRLQQMLAMPLVAERPSIGSLEDLRQRSLYGFLEPRCRTLTSG
jgi:hypothetical protein